MPSKSVVQLTCERCPRVWYTENDKQTELHNHVVVTVAGLKVVDYTVLCENCRKMVDEHVAAIGKTMKNHSPKRGARKKGEAAADLPSSSTPAPAAEASQEPPQAPTDAPTASSPTTAGASPSAGRTPPGSSNSFGERGGHRPQAGR